MHEPDKLRQQMALIGNRYLGRTLGELQRMRELVALAPKAEPATLKDLEHLAHKIHGSGAMFGFDTISDRAGEIEHLAAYLGRRHMAEKFEGLSDDELRSRLEDSMTKLEAETRTAAEQRGINVNAS